MIAVAIIMAGISLLVIVATRKKKTYTLPYKQRQTEELITVILPTINNGK